MLPVSNTYPPNHHTDSPTISPAMKAATTSQVGRVERLVFGCECAAD
jgi:hypothetical protein